VVQFLGLPLAALGPWRETATPSLHHSILFPPFPVTISVFNKIKVDFNKMKYKMKP
jgi:hypothetical protein